MTRKQILGDKLALFEAAGIPTNSFDTAIPQQWADELQQVGLTTQYFVSDCSGLIHPVLRCVAEPLYVILVHRAKANEEVWQALFVSSVEADGSAGDKVMFDIFKDNQAALDESDAGLLDLQLAVNLVVEAYARGRKDMHDELNSAEAQSKRANDQVRRNIEGPAPR